MKLRKMAFVNCPSCNTLRIAHEDYINISEGFCRSCVRSLGGKSEKQNRKTGQYIPCLFCSKKFWEYAHLRGKRKTCSRECFNNYRRKYLKEKRNCKFCNNEFSFSEKPFSNNSGNFCSLKCRNDSYSGYRYGYRDHRSRWTSQRKKFVKSGNDICSDCGKDGRIHIHHIIPYRLTKDNSFNNLVSLCPKCHSKYEKISDKFDSMPIDKRNQIAAIIGAILQDKFLLHKGLIDANKTSPH